MNRSARPLQDTTFIDPAGPVGRVRPASGRLIMILTKPYLEEASLANQLLALARPLHRNILLLGVCPDRDLQPGQRRTLVTIAAFLRAEGVEVEIDVAQGNDWLEKIKPCLRQNDLLACHAGQKIGKGKFLSDLLSIHLDTPLVILSRLDSATPHAVKPLLLRASVWAGSLAILAAFSIWQTQIIHWAVGGVQNAGFLLSLLAEAGSLWIWNLLLR